MASLNVESLRKKLIALQNTQDSIQTLSLWIIHHKNHYRQIVEEWIDACRNQPKISRRLTLLYLANDVLQNSKRKGATVFLDAFAEVLEDAATLCRDESIRKNVLRIFNIWEERNIYEGDFCEKLLAAAVSKATETKAKPKPKANSKILAEYKPKEVPETIEELTRFEAETTLKCKQLNNMNVDVTNAETIMKLKDRAGGYQFSKQFDEAATKLEDYVQSLTKEVEMRRKLVDLLDKGEIFYDAQYSEAKIVTNAYKNFGTRVSSLKKRLDEYKKLLPDPSSSPIPSPVSDAPSPGATPPRDPTTDTVEVEDMELSDEDSKHQGSIVAAAPIKPYQAPTTAANKQPMPALPTFPTQAAAVPTTAESNTPPASPPSPEGSPIAMSPPPASPPSLSPPQEEKKKKKRSHSHKHHKEHKRDHHRHKRSKRKHSSVEYHYTPSPKEDYGNHHSSRTSTPSSKSSNSKGDERVGTPVRDELDTNQNKEKLIQEATSNPIEFLTKLINKSQKSKHKKSAQSTSFINSLTVLSKNVKRLEAAKQAETNFDLHKAIPLESPTTTTKTATAVKTKSPVATTAGASVLPFSVSTVAESVEDSKFKDHLAAHALSVGHIMKALKEGKSSPPPPPPPASTVAGNAPLMFAPGANTAPLSFNRVPVASSAPPGQYTPAASGAPAPVGGFPPPSNDVQIVGEKPPEVQVIGMQPPLVHPPAAGIGPPPVSGPSPVGIGPPPISGVPPMGIGPPPVSGPPPIGVGLPPVSGPPPVGVGPPPVRTPPSVGVGPPPFHLGPPPASGPPVSGPPPIGIRLPTSGPPPVNIGPPPINIGSRPPAPSVSYPSAPVTPTHNQPPRFSAPEYNQGPQYPQPSPGPSPGPSPDQQRPPPFPDQPIRRPPPEQNAEPLFTHQQQQGPPPVRPPFPDPNIRGPSPNQDIRPPFSQHQPVTSPFPDIRGPPPNQGVRPPFNAQAPHDVRPPFSSAPGPPPNQDIRPPYSEHQGGPPLRDQDLRVPFPHQETQGDKDMRPAFPSHQAGNRPPQDMDMRQSFPPTTTSTTHQPPHGRPPFDQDMRQQPFGQGDQDLRQPFPHQLDTDMRQHQHHSDGAQAAEQPYDPEQQAYDPGQSYDDSYPDYSNEPYPEYDDQSYGEHFSSGSRQENLRDNQNYNQQPYGQVPPPVDFPGKPYDKFNAPPPRPANQQQPQQQPYGQVPPPSKFPEKPYDGFNAPPSSQANQQQQPYGRVPPPGEFPDKPYEGFNAPPPRQEMDDHRRDNQRYDQQPYTSSQPQFSQVPPPVDYPERPFDTFNTPPPRQDAFGGPPPPQPTYSGPPPLHKQHSSEEAQPIKALGSNTRPRSILKKRNLENIISLGHPEERRSSGDEHTPPIQGHNPTAPLPFHLLHAPPPPPDEPEPTMSWPPHSEAQHGHPASNPSVRITSSLHHQPQQAIKVLTSPASIRHQKPGPPPGPPPPSAKRLTGAPPPPPGPPPASAHRFSGNSSGLSMDMTDDELTELAHDALEEALEMSESIPKIKPSKTLVQIPIFDEPVETKEPVPLKPALKSAMKKPKPVASLPVSLPPILKSALKKIAREEAPKEEPSKLEQKEEGLKMASDKEQIKAESSKPVQSKEKMDDPKLTSEKDDAPAKKPSEKPSTSPKGEPDSPIPVLGDQKKGAVKSQMHAATPLPSRDRPGFQKHSEEIGSGDSQKPDYNRSLSHDHDPESPNVQSIETVGQRRRSFPDRPFDNRPRDRFDRNFGQGQFGRYDGGQSDSFRSNNQGNPPPMGMSGPDRFHQQDQDYRRFDSPQDRGPMGSGQFGRGPPKRPGPPMMGGPPARRQQPPFYNRY